MNLIKDVDIFLGFAVHDFDNLLSAIEVLVPTLNGTSRSRPKNS